MKAKFLRKAKVFALFLVCCLFLFGFAGCEGLGSNPNHSGNKGPASVEEGLSWKTFTIDGKTVRGKIPDTATEFSFEKEIAVTESVEYTVSLDPEGEQIVSKKSVPLTEGDNTFYVTVTLGEISETYTIILRRCPQYTITFRQTGFADVIKAVFEAETLTDIPAPQTENGYTVTWTKTSFENVTGDILVESVKTPVEYGIEYVLNGGDNHEDNVATYTVEDTVTLSDPSYAGHFFLGWYTDANCEGEAVTKLPKGAYGEKTFYAKWDSSFASSRNILVVERTEGESDGLVDLLSAGEYAVTVKNVAGDLPTTMQDLYSYARIILHNVANKDMPAGFDELLKVYVEEYGGGLLTVGGNDENGEANTYDREDMYGTLYQELLPVQSIEYSAPVGVMIVIDTSGSMGAMNQHGETYLDSAKAAAASCLDSLQVSDYVGIMTLESETSTVLNLTPRTQEAKILEAIQSIEAANGGTVFSDALQKAGQALAALTSTPSKRIILITDGSPALDDAETSLTIAEHNYQTYGISTSIIGIGMSSGSQAYDLMRQLADEGHGNLWNPNTTNTAEEIVRFMREDLNSPELREVVYEPFTPTFASEFADLFDVAQTDVPSLGGFYGTKAKENAEVWLVGEYDVPIYAQWQYGKGRVGSFMCDLSGGWSSEFISSEAGRKILYTIIELLFPAK